MQPKTTRAYSYVRFSSDRQAHGDSLRRQIKLAEDYAALHALDLDTNTYNDLGISAFKSKNAIEGALGAFLQAVDKGLIPKGSTLLVENIDRLSRAQVDIALELFLSIIRRGITIVTLQDKQAYSSERIREDKGISLIVSITYMMRAHEESATKGRRVKSAWDAKRASGKPMTKMCPTWLTLSEDRSKYIVNTEKALIVQRIFDLSMSGKGVQSIKVLFNTPGKQVPVLGNAVRWDSSAVAKILHNKAVMGTLVSPRTGIETEGYYPRIVEPDTFYRVQEAMRFRSDQGKGRKGENVANLFSGMCKCGDCGGPVRYVKRGKNAYLHCLAAYSGDGTCKAALTNYDSIEERLLFGILNFENLPIIGTQAVQDPTALFRVELEEKSTKLDRYLRDFEDESDEVIRRHTRERMRKLGAEIAELERQIVQYVPPVPLADAHWRAYELYLEHQSLKTLGSPELKEVRLKLQAALQPLIRRIVLRPKILKIENKKYVTKQIAKLTGMQEGELLAEGDPTYYREIVIYGPLVEQITKGEYADLYDMADDGGLIMEYELPARGMLNSVREAEYQRQKN